MTKSHVALLSSAAAVALAAVAPTTAAQAATKHKHAHKAAAAASGESSTQSEIRELREQIRALQSRLDSQAVATSTVQAQASAAQSAAQAAQAQVAAQASTVELLPETVKTEVAKNKPKTDKIYYKGATITLGGFLEAASIYRDHYIGTDISTGFNSIPFDNSRIGKSDETRFTARQSRLSLLAEGKPDPNTTLAMYGEFDFQAAGTTSNSNESNSYVPRIRHLYGTVDWADFGGQGFGLHLLAGQAWSLATMNTKGITPRNELTPPQIDAQYVPGFVWTRQPQFRVTGDFLDHKLWVAASIENPQTTFGGTTPALGGGTITNGSGQTVIGQVAGSGGLGGVNVSVNNVPDVVVKAAYEAKLLDRNVHLEAFGIGRGFTARQTITAAATSASRDDTIYGGGVGGGVVAQIVPGKLDAQVSGLFGNGIGRYGSSQLPDTTFDSTGRIKPIAEDMYLGGVTMHANKALDLYLFGGVEQEHRQAYQVGSNFFGYGVPVATLAGCSVEGGTCNATTREIDQVTAGFWQKVYQGAWGRIQFGVQYSYTERRSFSDNLGNEAKQDENMLFTSFRYYPF